MANILQLKRGLASLWTSINPILAQGEPGWEIDAKKLKIGDGITPWNTLLYSFTGGGGSSSNIYNASVIGTQNGINTIFTTASSFVSQTTRLYLNGQRLKIGLLFDYTESALNQITFINPPLNTDNIIIDYEY